MPSSAKPSPALVVAVLVFLACVAPISGMGIVGEVAIGAMLGRPPAVLVSADPPTWAEPSHSPTIASRWGAPGLALEASEARPLETLRIGPASLPIAINQYTGGLPDWPGRAAVAIAGPGGATVVSALYGLVVLGLLWRVLRVHGAVVGAGAAVLWLAADWDFTFYRRVLGGTEAWLLIGTLLVARGVWDRRWRGGGMAPWALALGVGMGLQAKATFLGPLAGMAIATLLTRWDRGPMGAPAPISGRTLAACAGLVLALLAPLAVANVHLSTLPDAPHVQSHDFVGLQSGRLVHGLSSLWTGAWTPAREQPANVASFLLAPLGFFARACGAEAVATVDAGRAFGLLVGVVGTILAWRDRKAPSQADALLRWLSIAIPVSLLALFLLNRDQHHLAQGTALLAMWGGLSVDRVAALFSPPRSAARGRVCAVLLLPWVLSGAWAAERTNGVLATCEAPIVTRSAQDDVARMLADHAVDRLVVCSYDLYGVLEVTSPSVDVTNGWGAMSWSRDRRGTMAALLRFARGGWYLAVRPEAHTIYDFDPDDRDLQRIADEAGVTLEPVDARTDAKGPWARLYRVTGP